MKQIIIAADDFGLTSGVNEAIAIACREGIVTTASLMVTTTGFESAVEIGRNHATLDLGLHLNLTEGIPVNHFSKIPSLADSSGFIYTHPLKLAAALFLGRVRTADLEVEIRSQIEKTIAAGLKVTHIDGHKHVHAVPAVARLIQKAMPEYGIRALRGVRERVPRLSHLLKRNKGARRQILLQYGFGKLLTAAWMISRGSGSTLRAATPRRFYGITQTGFLDLDTFTEILLDLDAGVHELMCHPGYTDKDLKQTPTRLHQQRERELKLLTSPEIRDVISRLDVRLATYKDLFLHRGIGECRSGAETGVLVPKG